MKTKFIALALLFCFASIVYAETLEELIEKSTKAYGGTEKLNNLKTLKITGKMNMMGMTMPFTSYMKKPAFRMEQEMMGKKVISAFDGKKGWMVNPMGGSEEPQEIPESNINQLRSQANPGANPLTTLKEEGITATVIGKETDDGTEVYKIKLVDKDQKESFFYLNAKTFLPHKMTTKQEIMGQTKDIEMYFKDYKDFGGYPFVTTIETKVEGMDFIVNFDNYEPNIPIDDSLFKMPGK